MINTTTKQAFLCWSIFTMLFASGAAAQTAGKKLSGEIAAANNKFTEAFTQNAGMGIGALYASDAMVMPPNSEPIQTSDAISKFWKGAYDAGVKKVKLETVSLESGGSFANETGKYTLYDANDKVIDSGKYLVFWKKEDGAWKLYRDIWNSSVPGKQ